MKEKMSLTPNIKSGRRGSCRVKPVSPLAPTALKRHPERAGQHRDTEVGADPSTQEDCTPHGLEGFDSNKDLRYVEKMHVSWSPDTVDLQDLETRTVYVRRLRPAKKELEPRPPPQGLMLPAGTLEEPLQVYNETTSMLQKKTEAVHQELRKDRCLSDHRRRALAAQTASLQNWGKALQDWDILRDNASGKLGQPKNSLLVSRTLPLPPPQNHSDPSYGPTSDFPQWKQKERSYPNDAFFLLPEHLGPEDDSFVFSLPWAQRQLYIPPQTMVHPDLGEQPPFQNVTGRTPQLSARVQKLKELSVIGKSLSSDHAIGQPQPEVCAPEATKGGSSPEEMEWDQVLSEPCGVRQASPYYVRNTVPAFKLDRFIYVWNQPSPQDIVEIGVVSNAGERGTTFIHLANVGCCTVRYSWRRLPHVDHFTTGRYRLSPFLFNSAGGILLPEEKHSITVQFYSSNAGRWAERWMVQTTPSVYTGPGEEREIRVSLWGQAMEVDVNLAKRQQMDRELLASAVQRYSETER